MKRRVRVLAITALVVALLSPVALQAPAGATPLIDASVGHPRILFTEDDVPALQARVQSGVPKAAYERLLARADAYSTPGSPHYVAPALVGPEGNQCYYSSGNTNVCSSSLKVYDGLFGQNQLCTVLTELGLAYQLSGKASYGRHAADILLSLARKNWPIWAIGDLGYGDLLAGVGLAFDWVYDAMTVAERAEVVAKLVEYENPLFTVVFNGGPSANPQSNWAAVSAGGAGLMMLAIYGEPSLPASLDIDRYLTQALSRVGGWLANTAGAGGDNIEGYAYAQYGLKNAAPFALAARQLGMADVVTGSNASRLARWASQEQLPGRGHMLLPLNDSGATAMSPAAPVLMMAVAGDDGAAQWYWNRTVGPEGDDYYGRVRPPVFVANVDCTPLDSNAASALGYCPVIRIAEDAFHILFWRSPDELPEVEPDQLSQHFEEQGLVEARSGFGGSAEEVVSSFSARREADGHFQWDIGSFTLYGQEENWAVDSGYSCVVCGDPDESGFALGHNVVVIDGNKLTQSNRFPTTPTIDGHVATGSLSWAHADTRFVYGASNPAVLATRDHLLSHADGRPVILAVTDHLNRNGLPHDYSWQMHTDAVNQVTDDGTGAFTVVAPNGATLQGLNSTGDVRQRLFKQKVAQDIHPVHNVLYGNRITTTYDNLAVLAVTRPDETRAVVRRAPANGGDVVLVEWNGGTDIVASRATGSSSIDSAVLDTDGSFAKVTLDLGDALLVGGTSLVAGGVDQIVVVGGVATVAVSEDSITAEGASGNSYRVRTPNDVTDVTVNGVAVSSCRVGDEVHFPC